MTVRMIKEFERDVARAHGEFLVILDNDGTLVDSETLAAKTAYSEFTKVGFHWSFHKYLAMAAGKTRAQIMEVVECEVGGKLPDSFHTHFAAVMLETCKKAKTFTNIELVLEAAPSVCLASNSTMDKLFAGVEVNKLERWFSEANIFGAGMVDRPKPDPGLFLHVADKMGFPAELCLVVGDGLADMQASQAADMLGFGFVGGSHTPDRGAHARKLRAAGAAKVYRTMRPMGREIKRLAGAPHPRCVLKGCDNVQ